jgi:hypothetical protein
MTGFKVQQKYADDRLRKRNLQSSRSTTCRAGRRQEPVERLQVDGTNWRSRPAALGQGAPMQPLCTACRRSNGSDGVDPTLDGFNATPLIAVAGKSDRRRVIGLAEPTTGKMSLERPMPTSPLCGWQS